MTAKEKYDFIAYDKRVLERNLKRHRITVQDYQKYLKSLSNDEELGEKLELPPPDNQPTSS